jgi:DNA replication and repair protein RecF
LWVERLELVDFRSYRSAALELTAGVTVLVGSNGRGKTNVLEALHRVAIGSSHRVAGDGALVREGASDAVIRTVLRTDEGHQRSVDVQLGSGRTRVKVDGQPVRRAAEATGVLRVVAFAPEDLSLVRGDPADRRRFLDELLSQRRVSYASALAEYERVLRQRNALLKDLRGGGHDRSGELQAWSGQLVAQGAPLVAARLAAVAALTGPVATAHAALTGGDVPVTLAYRSEALAGLTVEQEGDVHAIAAALTRALDLAAEEERRRGLTLVGPHRDELVITLDGLPARTTASQGEAWSVALACKVGSTALLSEVGDRPVLLLDDVFSELDDVRRHRVADLCAGFDQVLVTAAVDADVPMAGRRIDVRRSVTGAPGALGSTLHPRDGEPASDLDEDVLNDRGTVAT